MVTWVKCPKCRGEVGISDNSDSDVLCPRCREPVLLVDPETKTRWMPGKAAHSWRGPCGWILVTIASLMMVASVYREFSGHRNPSLLVVLIEYVTNPFILVGMPLGIYWIRRGSSPTRANDRSIPTTDPDSLLVKPDGSSPTRANDGSIPPVEQTTPTIANNITTDSASTGNSAALAVVFCVVAFFGALVVVLAILNSSTESKVTPSPVQPLATYDKAIADYNEAIRLNPTDANAYINRGNAWCAKKDYDKAIADYSEAIRLNPTDAIAYYGRGGTWGNKKEYDQAISDCNEAIRLDPRYAAAYCNRGLTWGYKKEYDQAIADCNEAIRLNPTDANAYINRGNAWHAKKDYEQAIADYNEAIRLDPQYAAAYNKRGWTWLNKKDYEQAIADYNEAIRLDSKDALAYWNRGLAWSEKSHFDKAISDFSEAIRLNPKDDRAYNIRGLVWLEKKDIDKALFDLNTAIRLNPQEPLHHYSLAVILFVTGREGVVDEIKKALDLGWQGDLSLYGLLIGYFTAHGTREDRQAKALLDQATTRCGTGWPRPIVRYVRGEIDETQLLASASDNDKMTQARYYLGLDLLQRGQKETALTHFRWIKEHGNPQFLEYRFALSELDRLDRR